MHTCIDIHTHTHLFSYISRGAYWLAHQTLIRGSPGLKSWFASVPFLASSFEDSQGKSMQYDMVNQGGDRIINSLDEDGHSSVDKSNNIMLMVKNGYQGKKKRLSSEQVKSLERSFDVNNKLEPERKNELACELGLEPKQVAVWFQNRRARCKSKHLEVKYKALKLQYDGAIVDKKQLQIEVARLKAMLGLHETNEINVNKEDYTTKCGMNCQSQVVLEDEEGLTHEQVGEVEAELSYGTGLSETLDATSPAINDEEDTPSLSQKHPFLHHHVMLDQLGNTPNNQHDHFHNESCKQFYNNRMGIVKSKSHLANEDEQLYDNCLIGLEDVTSLSFWKLL